MRHPPSFTGSVEIAPGFQPRPGISHVLFDFDGTLSLIRHGWADVMLEMFLELLPHRPGADDTGVRTLLRDDLWSLNGKPTIHQMVQFATRVKEFGGQPLEADQYEHEFQDRLHCKINECAASIRAGQRTSDDFLVHGARAFLDELRRRSIPVFLISGTELVYVKQEAGCLDIQRYFGSHIYGPGHKDREFSKRAVMERLMREEGIAPSRLLSFGDGHVETQNIKELGGLPVAVASDESNNGSGKIDPVKREVLLKAGASVVIPDYRDAIRLLDFVAGA